MKVYISADIEGCADVTAWCETESGQEGYESACRQMTLETAAACEAAIEMGYTPVVKDGHGNARNIDPWGLPRRDTANSGLAHFAGRYDGRFGRYIRGSHLYRLSRAGGNRWKPSRAYD